MSIILGFHLMPLKCCYLAGWCVQYFLAILIYLTSSFSRSANASTKLVSMRVLMIIETELISLLQAAQTRFQSGLQIFVLNCLIQKRSFELFKKDKFNISAIQSLQIAQMRFYLIDNQGEVARRIAEVLEPVYQQLGRVCHIPS